MNLARNPMGRWCWTDAAGLCHEQVVVVRAYPVTAPEHGVGVMDAEGHELAWFDRLDQVPAPLQARLREAIGEREFLPEIQRLKAVSSLVTPSVWTVDTHRGEARFMLKGEEDIRRLTGKTLIVSDADGVQYLIRDPMALDKHSRKLLDRFM
ncbi:MAG: hypothetical protein RL559_630 [Pseudomonadota bacterium]|jgi:hypothetical protein